MKCYYAPETEAHDPKFRLTHSKLQNNAERPERALLLLQGLENAGLSTQSPDAAPYSAMEAVHTPRFLTWLEMAWDVWQTLPDAGGEVVPNINPDRNIATYPASPIARAGWHMGDTSAPVGQHSWTASRRAVDCAYAAAKTILSGERAAYALCRPPGHHSSAEIAAGHCLMNVAAVAAAHLAKRLGPVAVLDIDVHHGNGTQAIFYDRSDVLTVSVHAATDDYYPFFTGYAHEIGTGGGEGFNLNLPLPRTTTDDVWITAIEKGLTRIADHKPAALILSLGLDAHENDPLLGMKVTFDGFERAGRLIASAGYPTVIIQEGGYLSPDLATSLTRFMTGYLSGLDQIGDN